MLLNNQDLSLFDSMDILKSAEEQLNLPES